MSAGSPARSHASRPPAPLDVARALQAGAREIVFLDSSAALPSSFSLVAGTPEQVLTGNIFRDAEKLREVIHLHRQDHMADLGVPSGGLFGWVGFDGEFVFGVHSACRVFQHGTQAWLGSGAGVSWEADSPGLEGEPSPAFSPLMGKEEFCERVRRAQEYIAAGDIYQVNLSYPWAATWPEGLDSWTFYQRLRAVSPAPYGAYFNLAGTQVFSASPECFLKISGSHVVTRPIKGTRPRSSEPVRDQSLAHELFNSPKERAELVMITDLERNDLGQICDFGSVRVTELLKLEAYAQVYHLVSSVEGTLREGVDHVEAFVNCFPGGSISGAPKRRALEIISELEPHSRGLYTGAIGYFGFNGESQFSIAIRTAWRNGDGARFHTGAGIVADSVPQKEWEETRHKAAGLLLAAR